MERRSVSSFLAGIEILAMENNTPKDSDPGEDVASPQSTFKDDAFFLLAREKAREPLRRAKEEWERTFDSVPDLVAILDNNHRVVRANRAMADRLGLKPEQCVGLLCYQAVHGAASPPAFCPHSLTCRDGREHTIEVREEKLGGDFLVTTTPLHDAQGRQIGSVHLARDITQLKKTEAILRRSREDLARAQEVGQIGSWRLDVRRNLLTWSDENHRIFGIPKGPPMTYETFLSVVHPDDRAYVDEQWNASLKGAPYDIEHRLVVAGEVKWVREKAFLEFDDDGNILGGFGITQDITDRKRIEEAYRNIALFPEENPLPVLRVSAEGKLIYANRASATLMAHWRCAVGEQVPDEVRWVVADALKRNVQTRWEARDSEGRDLLFAVLPISARHYVNFYASDVTEMNRAIAEVELLNAELDQRVVERTKALHASTKRLQVQQAELRRLTRRLTETREAERRRIAMGLHDEVGQLLAACQFRLEMVRRDPAAHAADLNEADRLLAEASDDIRELIFDLRSPTLQQIGLVEALRELAEHMRGMFDIPIKIDVGSPIPALPERLRIPFYQAARELLFNIYKHAEARTAFVQLACCDSRLCLTVRDDGKGSDNLRNDVRLSHEGVGLLHLREQLMELGGRMRIESVVGKGTTVVIEAPLDSEPET